MTVFLLTFDVTSDKGEIVIIDVLVANVVTLSFLCNKHVIQIACGQNHLVALSGTAPVLLLLFVASNGNIFFFCNF